MFATALIVFRETLEAALIVTIVMAATRMVPKRNLWVATGIACGTLGACVIAALMGVISNLFNGAGQDVFNAIILFFAVALICWHVVWMNTNGRKIAADMRALGNSVTEGRKHMSILAVVIGLAVMREGSEIVLMLQGLWLSSEHATMLGGGLLGLAAGIIISALMYVGFLALPLGRVFASTNIILVLISAGMAARGANFLVQADLVPAFGTRLWDTSAIIPDQSVTGQALAALMGYIARPNGTEVLSYITTIAVVLAMMATAHKNFTTQKHAVKRG